MKITKVLFGLTVILVSACTDNSPARTAPFEGTIETFAGTTFGHDGDGGPAKSAKLGYITGLSIDASGNLYVSDAAANVIRKVNTDNVISTIAGSFIGFNVVDPDRYSGDGGPATSAHLNVPLGLTVDAHGNIYISDTGNNVIRKVSSTGEMSTLIGGGHFLPVDNNGSICAAFNGPNGITTDADGNIYIVDSQFHRIWKIFRSGIINIAGIPTEAGYSGDGGNANAAKLRLPSGIAVGADGTIYFSDNNSVVRSISTSGTITTIAGTGKEGYSVDGGPATSAQLLAPKGVAIAADGSILVADSGNNRIRRITKEGNIETIAGTGDAGYAGDGGPAGGAKLSNPQGIAVGANGYIYVAESGNGVIRLIKPTN